MAPLRRLRVHGTITPPGDKSISHRALMLAAVTRGKSRISGLLDSADVRSTALALRALGADVPALGPTVVVTGRQTRHLTVPAEPIDCGNSGTTARLLAGVVAGAGVPTTFEGDASLSRRPMRRIADPLCAMGAQVRLSPQGGLPMSVVAGPLREVSWESPVASAQVKSAILLAAQLGGVRVRVTEPHLSRDHTERMLDARGVRVERDGLTVSIEPGQVLVPVDATVPADPSSAAFFAALGVLADEGEVRIENVCLNETRAGFFRVLKRMGADIELVDREDQGGEPVGTIVARPSELHAVTIAPDEVPSLIDELPLFACVAARVEGESGVTGARELRVKESDRIKALVANLRAIGVDAVELEDGFRVTGSSRRLRGAVSTEGDHRLAMSFGVLGATGANDLAIDDPHCVDVSFPGFWNELARLTS